MRATEALLLAAHDEGAVLAAATSLLHDQFGFAASLVLLYDRTSDELVMGRAAGPGSDDPDLAAWRWRLGEGPSGIAARSKTVINVPDLRADPGVIHVRPGLVSRLCVPMLVRGELLGVLVVESTEPSAFGAPEEEILSAFAQVTALALLIARNDQRRRNDIAQLQTVSDVASAAARLDLDASLRAAAAGFQEATSSSSTTIYLWDETSSKLVIAKMTLDGRHFPPDYEQHGRAMPLALGEGLAGWAAQQRRPLLIDDVQKDPRARPLTQEELLPRSAIVIPLIAEDRLLGVIRAVKMGIASYTQEHFRFAQTLASQVALLLAAAKANRGQRQRLFEVTALHEVSWKLSEASRLSDVLASVLDGAIRLTGADAGVIWRIGDDDRFYLAASQDLPAERIAPRAPNSPDSVTRRILASGRPLRIPDAQLVGPDRWPVEVPHLHGLLGIPLRSEGRAYGSLIVVHREKDYFRAESERILEVIAAQAAAVIARAQALEEAQRLATTDALTGLYNGRYLTDRLTSEIERARRYGRKLALLIVDSDALKLVNDRLGHSAGNELLTSLAATVRACVRASDIVARFGGDEFVILQPESGLDAAVATADRIRAAAYAASDAAGVERSVSVGVAVFPDHADGGDALFQQADAALYRAKRLGKNRVEAAGT